MAKKFKKVLAMLLAVLMMTSTMSMTVFAEETETDPAEVTVENVAKIGDVEYATLADAVAAANAMGTATIELLQNTVSAQNLTIKGDITLTGAYKITRATGGTLFTVNANKTLTLDGGLVIDGGNNWTFDSEGYYADMAACLSETPDANNPRTYTTSEDGGIAATAAMISIAAKGAVVMNNATIQNNWADRGMNNNGALFKIPAGATLTMNDGALIKHIRSSVVGQVSGTWTMNGGKIDDVFGENTNGGVVDIRGNGVVNINGGEITNVRTLGLNKNGNGIVFQVYGEGSKLNITGGWIHGNASFSPGGGWGAVVYLNVGGDFTMTGGVIEDTKTDICSAFVSNKETSIELLGGTIEVDLDTHPTRFESLFCGNVTIGENMNIVGNDGARFLMLGDATYTLDIDGTVSGDGIMWLMESAPITGTGTVTSDVLVKTHSYYPAADVTLAGANWNCLITVDSVGSDATLTVQPGANVAKGLVRVLDSVASGDYLNAEESAAEQAAAYVQESGANVTSPVLFYHRLTSAQQQNVVVTFDYNGGLDASGWSGCQLTSAEAFAPALPAPTNGSLKLVGWEYAKDSDPESLSMVGVGAYADEAIAESVRLIAQWEEPDYVCYIKETGVYYETLTAAVADANALEGANTIVMIKDIDFDSDKALSVTGDLTIIGAKTISRGAYTGTLFTVPADSSLTLDGGIVFDGSNEWIFNKELYEYDLYNRVDNPITAYAYSAEGGTVGTAAAFVVNGTVTANDATFQNFFSTKDSNAGDAAIFKVNANAVLDTNGALIDHNATYGANTVAHLATNAKWYIQGKTMISNNFGGRNGGVCRNDSGQIYMSGGTVKDNAGKNVNGTFIMMYGTGSAFYMTGGTICGNSSTFGVNNGRCAAVYLHANSYMKMTGGTICHNIGGSRGGIDSYKSSSVLDINRVDQTFVDGVYPGENGKDAYTASNHPMVVDNVSLIGYDSHDVGHSFNFDTWWITGGIYTQDVDEFCAKGYICIPYEDSERTDDYIVVPGYRVSYYAVDEVEKTDAETGETVTDIQTTLVYKYFHMLPRDKFWYEMNEKSEYYKHVMEDGKFIDTWYTEKELVNVYNFGAKLEGDLNLYGKVKEAPKNFTIEFKSGEASNISFMLIDKETGKVEFLEKIDIGGQTSFDIPSEEGKISAVFVKQSTSGMFWTSEEVSADVMDDVIACLKANNPSYKGHNEIAFGEGDVTWAFKKNKYVTYTFTCSDAVVDAPADEKVEEPKAPEAPVAPEAPKAPEAPAAPEVSAPAEPTLNVKVKGAEVSSWLVTGNGVTAVYIAADGKVPAVVWTSVEVTDDATMAAIIEILGADDDATVVFGMGSHDITYQHNKNKTKTVTYTFSKK